jgi:hypothetical protein
MSAPLPVFVRIHLLKTLQQPANILYDWSEVMMTQIAPMLAVSDENAPRDFHKAALGARFLWQLGGGGDVKDRECLSKLDMWRRSSGIP